MMNISLTTQNPNPAPSSRPVLASGSSAPSPVLSASADSAARAASALAPMTLPQRAPLVSAPPLNSAAITGAALSATTSIAPLVYTANGRLAGPDANRSAPVDGNSSIIAADGESGAVDTSSTAQAEPSQDGAPAATPNTATSATVLGPDQAQGENTNADSAGNSGGDGASQARDRSGSEDPRAQQQARLEEQQIAQLAARDREVRAHERAHQAVGGSYAGAASYSYQTGPDGKRYAVAGEVPIDVSPVPGDPRATIEKMRVVKAAATAPAEPSPQDRSVAAIAQQILVQAQVELAEQRRANSDSAETSRDESSEDRRAGVSEATRTYEEIIGLGRTQVDPRELINERV